MRVCVFLIIIIINKIKIYKQLNVICLLNHVRKHIYSQKTYSNI